MMVTSNSRCSAIASSYYLITFSCLFSLISALPVTRSGYKNSRANGKKKTKKKMRDLNPPNPMSTLRSGSIRSDLLGKQLLFQNPPKK
jgi:hypothetical protein